MTKTDLIETIKKQQSKEFNSDNLNFHLSLNLQTMEIPKDKILFRIGDPVVNFYFIFKGQVSVLKPITKKFFLSHKEYFFHLIKLNKHQEDYLLFQTINLNKEVLCLNNKEDLLDLQIAFLKFNFEKDKILDLFADENYEILQIKRFFNTYGLILEDLKIEENVLARLIEARNKIIEDKQNALSLTKSNKNNPITKNKQSNDTTNNNNINTNNKTNKAKANSTINNNSKTFSFTLLEKTEMSKWLNYLTEKLTFSSISKKENLTFEKHRDFITKPETVNLFTIQFYEKFLDLFCNETFGDLAFEKASRQRSATIRAEADSILGFVSNEVYENYIAGERSRLRLKEVSFIHENYFFKSVKINFLAKKYFEFFSPHVYSREKAIAKQSDLERCVCFIKEGTLQVTVSSCLLDLDSLQNSLIQNYFKVMQSFDKVEYEKLKKRFLVDFRLKQRSEAFVQRLKKPKSFKIFKLAEKEMCGFEPIFLQMQNFYSLQVHSEKAKVYKINAENLQAVLASEDAVKEEFCKSVQARIFSLLKRLKDIIQSSLQVVEDFIGDEAESKESALSANSKQKQIFRECKNNNNNHNNNFGSNFSSSSKEKKNKIFAKNDSLDFDLCLNKSASMIGNCISNNASQSLIEPVENLNDSLYFNINNKSSSNNNYNLVKHKQNDDEHKKNKSDNDNSIEKIYENEYDVESKFIKSNLNHSSKNFLINYQVVNSSSKTFRESAFNCKKINNNDDNEDNFNLKNRNINSSNNTSSFLNLHASEKPRRVVDSYYSKDYIAKNSLCDNNNNNKNNNRSKTSEKFIRINNKNNYNLNNKNNSFKNINAQIKSGSKLLEKKGDICSDEIISQNFSEININNSKNKLEKNNSALSISSLSRIFQNKILNKSSAKANNKAKEKLKKNAAAAATTALADFSSKIIISEESEIFLLQNQKANSLIKTNLLQLHKIKENEAANSESLGAYAAVAAAATTSKFNKKEKLENFNKRYLNSELKSFLNDPNCNFNNTNNYNNTTQNQNFNSINNYNNNNNNEHLVSNTNHEEAYVNNKTKDTNCNVTSDIQSKGVQHLYEFQSLLVQKELLKQQQQLRFKAQKRVLSLESLQLKQLRETQGKIKSDFANFNCENKFSVAEKNCKEKNLDEKNAKSDLLNFMTRISNSQKELLPLNKISFKNNKNAHELNKSVGSFDNRNFAATQQKNALNNNNPRKVVFLRKIDKSKSTNAKLDFDSGSISSDVICNVNNSNHYNSIFSANPFNQNVSSDKITTNYKDINNNKNLLNNQNNNYNHNLNENFNNNSKYFCEEKENWLSRSSKQNLNCPLSQFLKSSSKILKPLSLNFAKSICEFSNVQFLQNLDPYEQTGKIKFYEKKVKLKKQNSLISNKLKNKDSKSASQIGNHKRNKREAFPAAKIYINENSSNEKNDNKNKQINKIYEINNKNNDDDNFMRIEKGNKDEMNSIIINTEDIKQTLLLKYDKISSNFYKRIDKSKDDLVYAVKRYFKKRNAKGIKNYLKNCNSFVKLKRFFSNDS